MLRNRSLMLLGGCFLAASAAWADDVGYVDCSNHSEGIQVFAKPRKSPDVLVSVPCGERFTILVYGFVFSRVQTGDGQVGYVYSNMIAVDRAATSAQRAGTVQMASAKSTVPSTRVAAPKPAPAPSTSTPSSEPASHVPEVTSTAAQLNPPASALPQATPSPSTPMPAPEPASPAHIANATEAAATVPQPAPSEPAQPQPTLPQPAAAAPASAPAATVSEAPAAPASEARAAAVQPDRAAPAPPAPVPAEPPAPSIRPSNDRTTWEKPAPGMRRRAPLLALYGGYAFARMDGGAGTSSNVNGAMGSFGWNIKSWLQILGDSSYNAVTISGTKNVLYGNHFGARYFHRARNRWGLTPFAEALVGGSRSDTIISGTGGYTTSVNGLSYKVGGGLDIHPSRHFDIRLFDADYYRTAFGTGLHQNNYWISTGIVIRLFGGPQ